MSLINLESLIGWISQVATLLLTVDLQPNIIDIIGTFENAFFCSRFIVYKVDIHIHSVFDME